MKTNQTKVCWSRKNRQILLFTRRHRVPSHQLIVYVFTFRFTFLHFKRSVLFKNIRCTSVCDFAVDSRAQCEKKIKCIQYTPYTHQKQNKNLNKQKSVRMWLHSRVCILLIEHAHWKKWWWSFTKMRSDDLRKKKLWHGKNLRDSKWIVYSCTSTCKTVCSFIVGHVVLLYDWYAYRSDTISYSSLGDASEFLCVCADIFAQTM